MSNDRDHTDGFYTLMIEHLSEGGCSPHSLAVFERRLREFNESAGDEGSGGRKAEQDLVLETAVAEKLDELYAVARACEDSGDTEMAGFVRESAAAIGESRDHESLGKATSKAAEKIDAFALKREELLKNLTSAIMDYITILCCHGADSERRLAILSLDEKCASIEKQGETIKSLLLHPWFAAHLPLPETELEATAEAIEQMRRWPAIEKGAVSLIREEVKAALDELGESRRELYALHAEDEKRSIRTGFLAVSPEDSPGSYTFTKIWEGFSS